MTTETPEPDDPTRSVRLTPALFAEVERYCKAAAGYERVHGCPPMVEQALDLHRRVHPREWE